MLLPAEVNPISEKQGCKGNALVAYGISRVEIILTLLAEVIVLHIQASIIQVGITGFKDSFPRGRICLTIFLALDKKF